MCLWAQMSCNLGILMQLLCFLESCAWEVLFPGQTLHLKVIEPKIIAAMERALDQANASYILGVVSVYSNCLLGTTVNFFRHNKLVLRADAEFNGANYNRG